MKSISEIKDQKLMSIKFSTWARTECSSCCQEFEVTRSEPKSFKNNSEIICSECKDYSRAYKDGFEAGQQQYKSIVKTVDPDNLSECEVWVWCDAGLILGSIFIDLKNSRLKVDNYYGIFANPTHYIEQKDLIKLFEDSK